MAVTPPGLEFFSQEREGNKEAEALAQQISLAVSSELDEKVAERLESIFQQGEESVRQFSIQNSALQADLAQKVAALRESQTSLEVENAGLQQVLAGVLGQLAVWSGTGANAAFADLSSLKANTSSPFSLSEALTPSLLSPAGASDESSHSSGSNAEGACWDSNANVSKLPDIPAFPFASKLQQSPPVPFSLADALGIVGDAPPAVPVPCLSAALGVDGYLSCPPGFETEPNDDAAADGFVFCITIEKAVGAGLGLATSTLNQPTGVLHINFVLPGGAAEAWNWQCASSGEAEKVLLPGDSIVDVNGVAGDVAAMELECESKQQLRLMVVRGSGRCSVPEYVAIVPDSSTTLRAEASAFVPFSI